MDGVRMETGGIKNMVNLCLQPPTVNPSGRQSGGPFFSQQQSPRICTLFIIIISLFPPCAVLQWHSERWFLLLSYSTETHCCTVSISYY